MSYFSETVKKQKQVQTREYISWLCSFLQKNESFNDEDVQYNKAISDEDKKNASLISYFFEYLKEKAMEQSVFKTQKSGSYSIVFKYEKYYGEVWLACGQGAICGAKKRKSCKKYDTVILGKELSEKEKEMRKVSMYIALNDDVYMSKLEATRASTAVCSKYLSRYKKDDRYIAWEKYGGSQPEIFFADGRWLDIIKNGYVFIDDAKKSNEPIGICLGLLRKEEALRIIPRIFYE